MGLEASIERVFRRAMESDLELIAQNVSGDSSSNTTPQGSCMCACNISATVIKSTRERPEEQLYSVQRIVFQPVQNFPRIMDRRIAEANRHQNGAHGPHLDTLGTLLQSYKKTSAKKKPLKRNQILGMLSVMAEHYQDEGPEVRIVFRSNVITVGVVDYALKGSAFKKLIETNELRIPRIPSLERWPEEVQIGTKVYLRADKALRVAGIPPIEDRGTHPPGAVTLEQVVGKKVKKPVTIPARHDGFVRKIAEHTRKHGKKAIARLKRKNRGKPSPLRN